MKPERETILSDGKQTVVAYEFQETAFEFKWHYHPEFELTYISKGYGDRVVGDTTESFQSGDWVLLGAGLPHTWVSEAASSANAAIVVQFTAKIIADSYNDLPEWSKIHALLKQASRGIVIKSDTITYAKMQAIIAANGFKRLLRLYELLDEVTEKPIRLLTRKSYTPQLNENAITRLNKTFDFVHKQYNHTISLEKVAAEVGLTASSFSRFFKKMTGKTFIAYVNELRVRKACSLLIETDDAMPDIAFASGFNSITHFNRTFLQYQKNQPLTYRQKFRKVNLL